MDATVWAARLRDVQRLKGATLTIMLFVWRCDMKLLELWERIVDLPPIAFGTNECMKLRFDW